jgi:HEAT repeat protein
MKKEIVTGIIFPLLFLMGCTITKDEIYRFERENNTTGIINIYRSEVSEKVRYWALVSMGRLGDPDLLPYLLQGLEEEHWFLREEAAHGLGKLGDERALPGLIRALNDRAPLVRMEATNAITKIGKKGDIAVLEAALYDPDPNVRAKVAHVLGFLDNTKTTSALLKALDDPNTMVRQTVITTLGRLGDEKSVRFLIDILNDSQPDMRKQAAISLGKIGEYNAVEALDHLMKSDPSKEVRRHCRRALDQISRNIVQVKCSRCHAYYKAIEEKRSPSAWERIVNKMKLKNKEWMNEKETKLIVDYLLQHESVYETMDKKANRKFFVKTFLNPSANLNLFPTKKSKLILMVAK